MVFLTKFEKQALSKVSFAKNAAGKIAVLQAKFGTKLLLYAWGGDGARQLGLGDALHQSSPTQIGTNSWTSVSIGTNSGGAIRSDGLLFTWGWNVYGQLGNETSGLASSQLSPIQIGSSSWTTVSAGHRTMAAIRSDGLLFAWGNNSYGQLGQGNTISRNSPVSVGSDSWSMVDVSKSFYRAQHITAIRSDGLLFTWGRNDVGQLGDGTSGNANNKSSPVQIGSSSWTSVSAGPLHTSAITVDNRLFTWGSGANGRLGDGTTTSKSSPVLIGSSSWIAVSAGRDHTLGILSNNTLFAWGLNNQGQLGDGTTTQRNSPVQIGSSSWTSVSAGTYHTAAIRSDGLLFTWGGNDSGQLGDGTITRRSSPAQIGSSSWTLISTSAEQSTAISQNSTLFTWGNNFNGGLGNNPAPFVVLTPTPSLPGTSWSSIAVPASGYNATHTLAIRSDGLLFAWGHNNFGQLGTTTEVVQSIPAQVGTSSWSMVSAGPRHTAAIRSDGLLFTWGLTSYGALGNGSATGIRISSPVQIGSSSWTMVFASRHTAAIRSDGLLFTWGGNNSGQLGDGTTNNRSSPVQIGSSSWTMVSAGGNHTVAIRGDGLLFTWGLNSFGHLGDGTTASKSSPVQIGSSSWTSVSAGGFHTVAIRNDGLLFTWGRNYNGSLGDGTAANRSSPVQIGSSSWVFISAGRVHTAAIRSDNLLFTWGVNGTVNNGFGAGRLGDGTTTSRNSPVQIGTSSWVAVAAGTYHTLGLFPQLELLPP